MFGKRLKLFKLLGFEVRLDLSWIFIAILVVWSLSEGYFPYFYQDLSTQTYWLMGLVGALGLFISIIVHEFAHSLVARQYGMSMKGITLFIFGGVAEMGDEATSPKGEFLMAIAGPITSIVLAALFYWGAILGRASLWSTPIFGVLQYLGFINAILAGFNLLPAFPLDGGRVLRSILWAAKNNLKWATRISSNIGVGFGLLLAFLGILQIVRGNFVGGMWWVLIGMFLQGAARMSYQQILTRQVLEGEPISRFMRRDPETVPSSISVKDLVENYIYSHHYKMFPVMDDGKLLGYVTTKQVQEIPRDEWDRHTVGEIYLPPSPENTISPDADAAQALSQMKNLGTSRLLVTEGDRLRGIISLKDLMEFLSLKGELEQ
ncbi:MAG: M50 family metallopeptidase [Desulfobacteraceae bacterium]